MDSFRRYDIANRKQDKFITCFFLEVFKIDQESNAVAFLGSLAFGGQSWLSRLRTLAKALECSCLFLLLSGFGRNSNNE